MASFDAKLEQETWAKQGAEPPSQAELDSLEQDMRLWVPDFPGIFDGKRILDLGAGRGMLGILAAKKFKPALVVSSDLGFHRLHACSGFVGALSGFHAVCGDAYRLPFPDGCFDFVIANSFLHHLPELEPAVKEFTRVLRPGGMYVGREPNFNNPALRIHVFQFSGTWIRKGEPVTPNEYPLRSNQIERAFVAAGCKPELHFFWRRWQAVRHRVFSIAVSVRAVRL